MFMNNTILLFVFTLRTNAAPITHKDREEINKMNLKLSNWFSPFNYKGNVLEEHVKVACGTPGFRGTQFEKHWLHSVWKGSSTMRRKRWKWI